MPSLWKRVRLARLTPIIDDAGERQEREGDEEDSSWREEETVQAWQEVDVYLCQEA